jgi:hypothetical protein
LELANVSVECVEDIAVAAVPGPLVHGEHCDKLSGSMQGRNYILNLADYQLLNQGPAA